MDGGEPVVELMGTLRRHGWALVAVVVLIGAGTLALFLALPPRYSAKASVWLDHRLDNDVAAGGGSSPGASVATRRNTEIKFLTSPNIAARVVDKLGLAAVRGIGQPDRHQAISNSEGRQRAVAALVDGARVKATGASYAVVVNFAATDPVVATAIVNQLVDQYVTFRREPEQHNKAVAQLRRDVGIARDEMIRTAAAASAFKAAVKAFERDEQSRRLRDEVASLRAELRTERGRNDPASPDLTAAERTAELRNLRAQLARLSAERPATRAPGRAQVPNTAAADARAVELERRIANTRRQITSVAMLVAAGQLGEDDEALARRNVEQQRVLDSAAQAAARRHSSLDGSLQRLVVARPASAGAYVIARAAVPRERDFPEPWVFAVGGLLAAVAAAAATVLFRERLTSAIHTRRAAERKLGIPVIGVVPDTAAVLDARDAWINPIDLIVAENTSSFRMAFRSILLGLGIGRGEESPRSIVVSSAVAEEGKTTVAIGLARSAALAGMRVLFIDCDVRLPAASRLLVRHPNNTLVDVLEGKVELKDALSRDLPSGAWVLGSREGGPAVNGLVGSDEMMQLIRQASASYDLVVLDAAPALALAEAATLASFADMTLMIARWRKTPVRATRLAVDTLRDAGAKVNALVLTRVGA